MKDKQARLDKKLWQRTDKIEDKMHPTRQYMEELKTRSFGVRRKRGSLDSRIKEGKQKEEKKEEIKIREQTIPHYLYRPNPAAWQSARIKYNQSWGSRIFDKINIPLGGIKIHNISSHKISVLQGHDQSKYNISSHKMLVLLRKFYFAKE